MGTLDETTSLVELGAFMVLVGAGLGMLMQNLVLVVQNAVPHSEIGSGSSLIAFFRSIGGAVGVSVLGALLAHKVDNVARRGPAAQGVRLRQRPGRLTLPAAGRARRRARLRQRASPRSSWSRPRSGSSR